MADLRERRPTALLATFFVVAGGGLSCLFIAAAFARDVRAPAALVATLLAVLSLVVWSCREKPEARLVRSQLFWLLPRRRKSRRTVLRMSRKRQEPTEFGTNQPPTAARIRELADSGNTWVPARNAPRQRRSPL